LDNESAKREFIEAYFSNLEQRIKFTESLYEEQKAEPEALLLCCCYIEGIGNCLYPDETGSTKTFVRVLREHAGEPFLLSVHPRRLAEALPQKDSATAELAELIMNSWGAAPFELLNEDDFIERARVSMSPDQLTALRREVWRGTIAALAYGEVRGRLVHRLGAGIPIGFDQSRWEGGPPPEIDFPLLYRALSRVFEHSRQVSLSSNNWFGID